VSKTEITDFSALQQSGNKLMGSFIKELGGTGKKNGGKGGKGKPGK
jgi:hypothetical protein